MQQSSSTPEYLSVARFVPLATPQRYPRAGSQSYPTPAAEPNPAPRRSTSPRNSRRRQARQLDSNHAWQGLERDAASLQPARTVLLSGGLSEVELMK
jgi:hypothetical protein